MKATHSFALVCLALWLGAWNAPAQNTLGIAASGNQSVIFWPVVATNAILESTTNLASPDWLPVPSAPVVTNDLDTVTMPAFFAAQFFRLVSLPLTNSAGMDLIPAGNFTMGDTLDGESDAVPTNVYVSAFYMDANLVSYALWTNAYAYATTNGYGFNHAGSAKNSATNQPVQMVDWYDCVKWCNARSQRAGLPLVYFTDAAMTQVFTNGEPSSIYVNWDSGGYRLPTEAEWEKAARGGLSGQRFPWGLTISEGQANYYAETNQFSYDLGPYEGYNTNFDTGVSPYTSPVGTFPPNGYGLKDMAGNLYEWCGDWYGTPYGQPTTNNPTGVSTGTGRVLRGGLWVDSAKYCRTANRDAESPTYSSLDIGFRSMMPAGY